MLAGSCGTPVSSASQCLAPRTQARPEIELVSGEAGLASKVLLLPLLLPQVRRHGQPELRKWPLAPLVEQRGIGGAVLPKHSSFLEQCVVRPFLLVSIMLFTFKRCRFIICPVGQRLWRPVLHVASFVRCTQPGWISPGPSLTSLLKRM